MADATSAWSPGGVLAVTKFHVPDRRPGLVERDALVALLMAGRHAKLILVSAPPGAGKTTLLTEWCAAAEDDHTFAWLSLDPDDGDPTRFWGCVVAAIRTVVPDFGVETLGALRSAHGRLLDVVVPLLINEAAELRDELVLVLDDLHVVSDPSIHRSLAFLVDRLPSPLRLAIATRADPPLPLARWRARGEVIDIRAPDLRFTDGDAARLLADGFGIQLDGPALARLQLRTEGWAAGLQLAGLSLRRGGDVTALLDAFAGDREVIEYLAGEVLDAQEPATRTFMLRTSVLARMTGPLCDAVTGSDDGAARLEDLDKRNLLVLPLDAERRWWRYHHLFAELLQRELERTEPEQTIALHRGAAEWHAQQGMPAEAIRHALAAAEPEMAADLVAEHWSAAFNAGELATVDAWLDALPPRLVVADARLWLARLWTAMDRGRLVEAGAILERAQRDAIPAARDWAPVLRGLYAFKRGDLVSVRRHLARTDLDAGDAFWQTTARLVTGVAAYAAGTPDPQMFLIAADLAEDDGNRLGLAYALGYLALIAAEGRRDEEAATAVARLDALIEHDRAIGEHFVAFAGELARAAIAERSGAYEAAAAARARGVELARRGAGLPELCTALVERGRLEFYRGHRDEARRLAREARRALDGCPDPGRITLALAELELRTDVRRAADAAPPAELSDSELAVLHLLPTALSNREIGDELFVSVNTVKTHLRSIYSKLRARSREQAVGRAREIGLL